MVEYHYGPAGGVNDRLSRVERIVDVAQPPAAGSVLAAYSYLGDGTIVRVEHPEVAGGLTLSYGSAADADGGYAGLDRLGRVVRQAWSVDGSPVDEYRYTYDRNSNRLTRTNELNAAFSEAYAYDALNRLIGTTRAGDDYQQWGYDQLGNWATFATDTNADGVIDANDTPQERTANEANEITGITGTGGTPAGSPTYDAAGNMTFDGRQHYRYDAWNRLVAAYADEVVAQPPPAVDLHVPGDLIAVYQYDGRGYRVSKSVARYDDNEDPHAVTGYRRTDYLYNDGWQVLEERFAGNVSPTATPAEAAAAGTPHVQYVWDLRYIDAVVCRFRDLNGDGDFADEGDETLYYCNDANMNVTALVAPADGSVAERYVYDPYGQTAIYNSTWTGTVQPWNSAANAVTYAGYISHFEAALLLARCRYYLPEQGTWSTRDASRYIDSLNLYEYAVSAPPVALDPFGHSIFIIAPDRVLRSSTATESLYWDSQTERRPTEGPWANVTNINTSAGTATFTYYETITFLDKVLESLRNLCPCVLYVVGQPEAHTLTEAQQKDFDYRAAKFSACRITASVHPSYSTDNDFCACIASHNSGCRLVHDLMTAPSAKNRSLLRYANIYNGVHNRVGDTSLITFSPFYVSPGTEPYGALASATITLAHEFVHAWDKLLNAAGSPHPFADAKLSRAISDTQAKFGRDYLAWRKQMETWAVQGANQVGRELILRNYKPRTVYDYYAGKKRGPQNEILDIIIQWRIDDQPHLPGVTPELANSWLKELPWGTK